MSIRCWPGAASSTPPAPRARVEQMHPGLDASVPPGLSGVWNRFETPGVASKAKKRSLRRLTLITCRQALFDFGCCWQPQPGWIYVQPQQDASNGLDMQVSGADSLLAEFADCVATKRVPRVQKDFRAHATAAPTPPKATATCSTTQDPDRSTATSASCARVAKSAPTPTWSTTVGIMSRSQYSARKRSHVADDTKSTSVKTSSIPIATNGGSLEPGAQSASSSNPETANRACPIPRMKGEPCMTIQGARWPLARLHDQWIRDAEDDESHSILDAYALAFGPYTDSGDYTCSFEHAELVMRRVLRKLEVDYYIAEDLSKVIRQGQPNMFHFQHSYPVLEYLWEACID